MEELKPKAKRIQKKDDVAVEPKKKRVEKKAKDAAVAVAVAVAVAENQNVEPEEKVAVVVAEPKAEKKKRVEKKADEEKDVKKKGGPVLATATAPVAEKASDRKHKFPKKGPVPISAFVGRELCIMEGDMNVIYQRIKNEIKNLNASKK